MGSRCERCQQEIAPGALRFAATLRLCGDTGGALDAESRAALRTSGRDALDDALRAAEALSEAELMEAVVEEFRFVLCGGCRAQLRSDPAGASNVRAPARRAPQ